MDKRQILLKASEILENYNGDLAKAILKIAVILPPPPTEEIEMPKIPPYHFMGKIDASSKLVKSVKRRINEIFDKNIDGDTLGPFLDKIEGMDRNQRLRNYMRNKQILLIIKIELDELLSSLDESKISPEVISEFTESEEHDKLMRAKDSITDLIIEARGY